MAKANRADGRKTRDKILEATRTQVLENGFVATSIDKIIDEVGITKGAFFYHFKTKNDLAAALIENYADADIGMLKDFLSRAEKLARDPLQQILIFIGLFIEMADELVDPYPGCLFASFCYESGQFEDETLSVVDSALREWRHVLKDKFVEIEKLYRPRITVDLDSLADMITVVFEGAYIVSRSLVEVKVFANQLRHFRNYIELLYSPAAGGDAGTPEVGQ